MTDHLYILTARAPNGDTAGTYATDDERVALLLKQLIELRGVDTGAKMELEYVRLNDELAPFLEGAHMLLNAQARQKLRLQETYEPLAREAADVLDTLPTPLTDDGVDKIPDEDIERAYRLTQNMKRLLKTATEQLPENDPVLLSIKGTHDALRKALS